jgi:hypothetical protein
MADDAHLVLVPEGRAPIGVSLASAGALECLETPAVLGWLHAHGEDVTSARLGVVPAERRAVIPADAESLGVPLSTEEASRVRQAYGPADAADAESELLAFREAAGDWRGVVHRALDAGLSQARIAELTGLTPQRVAEAAAGR